MFPKHYPPKSHARHPPQHKKNRYDEDDAGYSSNSLLDAGELPDAPDAEAAAPAPEAPAKAQAPKPAPKPAVAKPKVKARAGSPKAKAKVNVAKPKVQPRLAETFWGMWLQILEGDLIPEAPRNYSMRW